MAVVHQDQSDVIEDGSYISQKAVTITPSRNDHGKILSCIASHQELSENLQCTVNMNVHVLPMSVLLFPTGGSQSQTRLIYVQEDSPTSITCKSIGSFPATELSFQLESGNGLVEKILPNISSERSILDDALFDTEGTVILHLNIVHHGQYIKCFASLEEPVVELVYAKVIVNGPPEGIKITSPMDLYDGIEINVTCKAVNGYPAPHIHWYIGSRNLTEESSLNISENKAGRYDAESTLTLIPTSFDHGERLLCLAVQPTTLPARSVNQSLVLNIKSPPNRLYITDGEGIFNHFINNLSLTVIAGQQHDITCEAYEAMPPAVLEWCLPDDMAVVHQDQSDVIQDSFYISQKAVRITLSRNDHGKILTCIASHPQLSKSLQCSVHLNVHVLPMSVLLFPTGGSQSQTRLIYVQEDSPTSITCRSIGSFPATELSFQLESGNGLVERILPNISSERSILDDALFDTEGTVILHLNIVHHGQYIKCFASLEEPVVELVYAKVIVNGPPEGIKITSPMDLYDGIEINVTCKAVNGYPAPHIHWYIGSRNLTEESSLNISENKAVRYDAESTLTIIPTSFDHGERLLCLAVQPTTLPGRSVNQSLILNIKYLIPNAPSGIIVHQNQMKSSSLFVAWKSVLPTSVLLFLTGGNQSQSTVFYVQDDSPTSITCKSIGTFPATELTFQLESGNGLAEIILPNISSKTSILDDALFDTEGTVIIHPNIVHHGKYINCFALLEESLVEWLFAKVVVYGPPEGIKITSPMDLYDGIEINVTCKAVNGYPAPHIHWYIGSRNPTEESSLNISENKAGRYDAESTLTLIPTSFDHGERLLCLAVQSTTLPARSVNQSLVLNIKYLVPNAPSGIIAHQNQMKSSSLFVAWKQAGQQHDITCEAYEAMPPAVLEWCLPDDMAVVHQDQSDVIQDSFYISQKAVRITLSRNDHGKILTCIASHPQLSKSLQCSVHLNVHVLPMSVLLFLTGGNQSQSTVFYVQDDSPTSITCKIIGSFPATELTFQLESGNGLAEIILPNISSKTSILDDALFDTEGAPEGIKINFPLDLYDGTEINVTCKAANGYPAPHIHWYIGSRNLTTDSSLNISENKAGRYDAESTLTLIPTRFDHGKSLICLAVQTTTLPARSVNQSLVLNITYHPAVSITARHLTSNKASGTTELVLICEADANPPAITFVWLCNETVVSNDPNYYKVTETLYEDATLRSSVLAIQNPLIMYHYVYNCTAVSEYGSGSAVLNSLYLCKLTVISFFLIIK
nr:uncharacterized protein LOC129267182 [Lytechinus pictus]